MKISLASLEVFKNHDYFANYMYRKCKDNKISGQYKVVFNGIVPIVVNIDSDEYKDIKPNSEDVIIGQTLHRQFAEISSEQNDFNMG